MRKSGNKKIKSLRQVQKNKWNYTKDKFFQHGILPRSLVTALSFYPRLKILQLSSPVVYSLRTFPTISLSPLNNTYYKFLSLAMTPFNIHGSLPCTQVGVVPLEYQGRKTRILGTVQEGHVLYLGP